MKVEGRRHRGSWKMLIEEESMKVDLSIENCRSKLIVDGNQITTRVRSICPLQWLWMLPI